MLAACHMLMQMSTQRCPCLHSCLCTCSRTCRCLYRYTDQQAAAQRAIPPTSIGLRRWWRSPALRHGEAPSASVRPSILQSILQSVLQSILQSVLRSVRPYICLCVVESFRLPSCSPIDSPVRLSFHHAMAILGQGQNYSVQILIRLLLVAIVPYTSNLRSLVLMPALFSTCRFSSCAAHATASSCQSRSFPAGSWPRLTVASMCGRRGLRTSTQMWGRG